jgi:putative transposase
MSRSRYHFYETEFPYFMTATVVAWLPIFAHPVFVEIILNSWRFLQKERNVKIYGFVIMENHLHWIASAPDLFNQVGRAKSFTARQIIETMESRGFATLLQELKYFKLRHKKDQTYQIWQEGSHPEQIKDDEMMLQKLEYMHNNPLRRGYVDEAVNWRYSSARNYAGLSGLIEVVMDWR